MDWDESHPLFWLDEEEFYGADPRADLDHWSRSPCWTVEEATALWFGKEPRIVNWAFLREFSNHPFAETYRKRLEHGLRATQIGDLGGVNRPVDYIEWAKGIDFEFSPEVENAVRAHESNVRDWRSDYEALATERDELAAEVKRLKEEVAADALRAKPLLESERESLLIMIAAMAQKVISTLRLETAALRPRSRTISSRSASNSMSRPCANTFMLRPSRCLMRIGRRSEGTFPTRLGKFRNSSLRRVRQRPSIN